MKDYIKENDTILRNWELSNKAHGENNFCSRWCYASW